MECFYLLPRQAAVLFRDARGPRLLPENEFSFVNKLFGQPHPGLVVLSRDLLSIIQIVLLCFIIFNFKTLYFTLE